MISRSATSNIASHGKNISASSRIANLERSNKSGLHTIRLIGMILSSFKRSTFSRLRRVKFKLVSFYFVSQKFAVNLPPLCTQKDVGSRILMQQRTEAAKAAAESEAMEVDSDSDEEQQAAPAASSTSAPSAGGQSERAEQRAAFEITQPMPAPPTVDSALVRDYDPRKARQQQAAKLPESYIISPLTNERISADKLQDHVRYNTVDPQYKEQRDR